MPKLPVSVTLDADNLLWLRGQTASRKRRSLSEAIDAILTAARLGRHGVMPSRSVAGTIDLAADDPGLEQADAYVRGAIESSIARPLTLHESRGRYAAARRPTSTRAGKTGRARRG